MAYLETNSYFLPFPAYFVFGKPNMYSSLDVNQMDFDSAQE